LEEVRTVAAHDDDMNRGIRPGRGSDDPAGQVAYLEQEIAVLRRKLADSPRHTRILEERIVELQTNLAGVSAQNERLANTLREARDQIVALKEEVDRLAQPPAGFGVFLVANEDGTADIFTGGRKLRVNVSPSVELEELRRGQEVMLNEALNVVEAMEYESVGEIVTLKEILEDGEAVRSIHIDTFLRDIGTARGGLTRVVDDLPQRVGVARARDGEEKRYGCE